MASPNAEQNQNRDDRSDYDGDVPTAIITCFCRLQSMCMGMTALPSRPGNEASMIEAQKLTELRKVRSLGKGVIPCSGSLHSSARPFSVDS